MLAFWILALAPALANGAGFKAGVATVDITPPPGLPMYGYFDRIKEKRLSTGTLDPLYARALVLEAGDRRIALVTLDLGRCFGKASLDRLREQVQRSSGISLLLVTASHTHAGPNVLDEYPGNQPPAWERDALAKIAQAVDEARRNAVEARLGTGYGSVDIGYNRRVVHPDGTVTMLWRNPTQVPTHPVDPTVGVLRLDSADGKPLAILVNYACHPVIFGTDNQQYSADYVGVMRRTVEAAFAPQPICFFLQGADGDINPYFATTPVSEGAVEKRDWTGQQLAQEVIRVARNIRTTASSSPGIDFTEDAVTFRVRWPAAEFRRALLEKFGPSVFEDHADLLAGDPPPETLTLSVATVLVNRQMALATMPGEPFVDFQIAWRKRCPVRDAFLLGYTNGYFDYFPTLEAASQGGYGAGDSDTYIEVGAGERMLERSLVRVYEMLGKMADLPEDLL